MDLLTISIIGFLAWYGYHKVADLSDKLSYKVSRAKIDSVNTDTLKMLVSIVVTNPTDTGFQYEGVKAQIKFKGTVIGNVDFKQAGKILPNSDTTVQLPIYLPVKNILSLTPDLITNIRSNPVLEVNGEILFSVGSLKINFKKSFA